MRIGYLFLLLTFSFLGCNTDHQKDENSIVDSKLIETEKWCDAPYLRQHSFANIDEVKTVHLALDLVVDFDHEVIHGVANHSVQILQPTDFMLFDVKGLSIEKVFLDNDTAAVDFDLGESLEVVGRFLKVPITPNTNNVIIHYKTTKNSKALDWLKPTDKNGLDKPFVYSQGQPILTRTWIPIQDDPSQRITYSANVQVPRDMLPLMSATNPQHKNDTGTYYFEMNHAIPPYLIAIAVGDLHFKSLNVISGIYALPNVVDVAAEEFHDIPEMINAAADLYGPYIWERFDVLVLPASFPFGGMENPRLTFATPTLIAGDRSLVSVVAHELAHSWSGNLVTNATWEDIWLNEGFTVYFENRIMEKLYGKDIADMLFLIEYQELIETIDDFKSTGKYADTHLKLDLTCRDPDEGLTDIAYVKGGLLLKTLEEVIGRDKMDAFLTSYFNDFAFQTLTTEQFLDYFYEHVDLLNKDFEIEKWIYEPGIPDGAILVTSKRFDAMKDLANAVQRGEAFPDNLNREDRITQEWLTFIRGFDAGIPHDKIEEVERQLGFAKSGNAEIMTEWFVLAIEANYAGFHDEITSFLTKVGRRKFLRPLYEAIKNNPEMADWGLEVFQKAKAGYHPLSAYSIAQLLEIVD